MPVILNTHFYVLSALLFPAFIFFVSASNFKNLASLCRSHQFLLCFLYTFIILMTPEANAQDYSMPRIIYVNQNMKVSSPSGTETSPFSSIQSAVSAATPGSRIIVKAGTYNENVIISNSGTESNPIIIEGEKGANGEYLTEINSGNQVSNWIQAPEIGPGVYKVKLGFNPGQMSVNGLQLGRLADSEMSSGTGFEYLRSRIDFEVDLMYPATGGNTKVKFWDVIFGIYGFNNDYIYLRLKNGENPNNLSVMATKDNSTGFKFYSKNEVSYVTIKNFNIQGQVFGIKVEGNNYHHISILNNRFRHGKVRILISQGAHDITIANNDLALDGYSVKPGAWIGSILYVDSLKQYLYLFYKWVVGESTSDDTSIILSSAGNNIIINNNFIHDALKGIVLINSSANSSKGHRIFDNVIEHHSSVGITMGYGITDTQIFRNRIYNNNINLRIHMLEIDAPREYFVFNNRLIQPKETGDHIFMAWITLISKPKNDQVFYVYHNDFQGGYYSLRFDANAWAYGYVPHGYFINNVFSGNYKFSGENVRGLMTKESVGAYDYNWIGDAIKMGLGISGRGVVPVWLNEHNVSDIERYMWDPLMATDFKLPATSLALEAGIDLSKKQLINGQVIGPLPGLDPGYFSGKAPNIGILNPKKDIAGDVSGDGIVSMYDAALLSRSFLDTRLSDLQSLRADADENHQINNDDVKRIKRKAIGL